jgi:hypothetical protein
MGSLARSELSSLYPRAAASGQYAHSEDAEWVLQPTHLSTDT